MFITWPQAIAANKRTEHGISPTPYEYDTTWIIYDRPVGIEETLLTEAWLFYVARLKCVFYEFVISTIQRPEFCYAESRRVVFGNSGLKSWRNIILRLITVLWFSSVSSLNYVCETWHWDRIASFHIRCTSSPANTPTIPNLFPLN